MEEYARLNDDLSSKLCDDVQRVVENVVGLCVLMEENPVTGLLSALPIVKCGAAVLLQDLAQIWCTLDGRREPTRGDVLVAALLAASWGADTEYVVGSRDAAGTVERMMADPEMPARQFRMIQTQYRAITGEELRIPSPLAEMASRLPERVREIRS